MIGPLAFLICGLVVLLVALLWTTRGTATPFYLTFLFEAFFAVGYFRIADDQPYLMNAFRTALFGLAALVLGYGVGHLMIQRQVRARQVRTAPGNASFTLGVGPPLRYRATRAVFAVFLVLTVYHFFRSGIPILSSRVELDRWDFTASGLYGFPGRAYLLGLPLALILLTSQWRYRREETRAYRLYLFILGSLIVTRLIGGFKGELLDILFIVLLLRLSFLRPTGVLNVVRRYWVAAAIALIFAYNISLLYSSVQTRSRVQDSSPASQLLDRMTTVAARPGATVIYLRQHSLTLMESDTLLNDLRFYVERYLTGRHSDRFAFKTVVSAFVSNRSLADPETAQSLDARTFIVPVTVGAFPVLYYNYGTWAFLVFALLGLVYAVAEGVARAARSSILAVAAIVMIVILHAFIHKGDLVFQLFNWSIMAGITSLFFLLFRDLVHGAGDLPAQVSTTPGGWSGIATNGSR